MRTEDKGDTVEPSRSTGARVLADRAYDGVKDRVEPDMSQGLAERLNAARRRVMEGLSDSEIEDRIAKLDDELALRRFFGGESSGAKGLKRHGTCANENGRNCRMILSGKKSKTGLIAEIIITLALVVWAILRYATSTGSGLTSDCYLVTF